MGQMLYPMTTCSNTPISFKITIKGDIEMNYRLEKKESFRIVGVSEPLETKMEKNFEIVPKMWGTAVMNQIIGDTILQLQVVNQ